MSTKGKTLSDPTEQEAIRARLLSFGESDTPAWGMMSAPQVVCHLRDCLSNAVGKMSLAEQKMPVPRWMLKAVILNLPMEWPKGKARTAAELDYLASGGTAPTDFAADKASLSAAYQDFLNHRGPWPNHFFLGPMTERDWKRMAWLHADHHLRQFGH